MRFAHLVTIAAVAVLLAACGTDQAYLKAQADAITAQSNARVAEAQAAAEEAKAVVALSAKIDAGGAAGYLIAKAMKGLGGSSSTQTVSVNRPRDWVDYVQAGSSLIGAIANVAVPIVTVKETSKTQRYLAEQNVNLEGVRQTGETARFGQATSSLASVGIAGINADRGAHTTTTITAGGDVANNGSSIARLTCEATGGAWTPSVPTGAATTTPPSLSGSAGAGTCTQR